MRRSHAFSILLAVVATILSASAQNKMRVETWDLQGDLGIEAKDGVRVRKGVPPPYGSGHEQPLPGPHKMDRVFDKAGLLDDVSEWDQLERDILYRRARIYALKDLESYYPKLPSRGLSALIAAIKRFESKGGGK